MAMSSLPEPRRYSPASILPRHSPGNTPTSWSWYEHRNHCLTRWRTASVGGARIYLWRGDRRQHALLAGAVSSHQRPPALALGNVGRRGVGRQPAATANGGGARGATVGRNRTTKGCRDAQ